MFNNYHITYLQQLSNILTKQDLFTYTNFIPLREIFYLLVICFSFRDQWGDYRNKNLIRFYLFNKFTLRYINQTLNIASFTTIH